MRSELPSRLTTILGVFGLSVLAACSSSSESSTTPTTPPGADAGAESGLSADGTPPTCAEGAGGSTVPPARGDVGGALDPTGRRMVIFGGDVTVPICGEQPTPKFDASTWVFDVACGSWRNVPAGDAPSARARHSMVADVAHNRALLFGGRYRASGTAYTLYNDVWAFDFATESWTKLDTTGTAPAARANTSIATVGNRLIVFGGNTSTNGLAFSPNNDTFSLDLETLAWTPLGGAKKPPPRLFQTMAIDPETQTAYVYGGGDEQAFTGPFLNDLWALDLEGGAWREVQTTGTAPVPRINAGLMFDQKDKSLVVFGGHDDGTVGNQNDLFRISPSASPATWSQAPLGDVFNKPSTAQCDFPADFTTVDKEAPERRSAFAFAPRADGHAFVVAFGKSDCGVVSDSWWWSGGPGTFKALRENPAGLSCLRFSTTCKSLCN